MILLDCDALARLDGLTIYDAVVFEPVGVGVPGPTLHGHSSVQNGKSPLNAKKPGTMAGLLGVLWRP